MAIAARVNTVAEGETPIASYKYNEEMDNVYTVLNSIASFFASGTPPASPGAGQYWLDTSVSPSVLRQFDGTVWRWTGFFFGTSAPSNPAAGAFFINSVSGTMAYWSGTEWVGLPATAISYDGTESGLLAENVQDAIDEISVDYEAAATAVTQAQGYASAASASAAGAAGSAGLAGDYALAASGSASDAETFAEKAEAWSDGEGEIEPGRFSAKTWADAASGIVVPDGSVSNAKLVDMAAGTLKGRNSEGTGVPEDLSIATVRGMIGTATTEADGLMSAADKTKLDGLGTGGSSVMLTLVHTTIAQSTTATAYDVLATGKIIGRSDWHGPELTVLLRRSGSGQIRISLSDGTTTVTAETAVFAVAGTDELTLDTTTLTDGVTWDLTVEALTDDAGVTVERLKILADPVNEFAPPLVGSGAGNSTNSTSWAELGTSTFLPTWLDVDGRGGVILLADVDLGTATGAEIRITIGTESATQAITSNGVAEIHCPFPSTPSAVMSAKIEGKVTGGSGTIALSHWQLHIEK